MPLSAPLTGRQIWERGLSVPGRRLSAIVSPSTPQGARWGGGDLHDWARQTVEKVRVASVGGRLRFLPWIDTYTEETTEIRQEYRVMLRESSVKAAFQTKILSVISEDVQFQPDNDDDPREREVAQFCAYAFRKLKGGTRAAGWSVLHPAIIDGHSVCEKVRCREPLSRGRFRGKRILHALKAKDTHFLQLGIDSYRNITALKGTGFNAGRVWSPSDFVIFSYFSLFENPAGLSDFRAAYRPYWIKHTCWQLRSLHLQNYTGPYLIGRYPQVEQKAALEDAFTDARANTWMTVPVGAMVEALDLSMKGTTDFKDAIQDCDREILIAIVGAHLQILEGQTGGARGNTKIHKEIGELIQWWLAATLADVYQSQIVVPLVEENYHDVEPPTVSVGAITDEAMLERAKVYKALQELGMGISKQAAFRTFNMQPPEDDEDTLKPAGGGGGKPGEGASPALPGGGEGASPFGESALKHFCDEGENKGKPGPCPEHQSAPHAATGAATRKALAGGADRVSLPGGAVVHLAAHPAGGHVAIIRTADGTGTSGHPRPTRAAAVADAQTLAVGHLKGKAPVGIPLPAGAAAVADPHAGPEAALRDTVSRLFPDAQEVSRGEYEVPVPGGRSLSLVADTESGSIRIDFGNEPESGLGQQDVPAALRAGSLELARNLKAVAGSLAKSGTNVSFGAVPRKAVLYAKVLSSLGFTRQESRPAEDPVEPGQVEEVWAPPKKGA